MSCVVSGAGDDAAVGQAAGVQSGRDGGAAQPRAGGGGEIQVSATACKAVKKGKKTTRKLRKRSS